MTPNSGANYTRFVKNLKGDFDEKTGEICIKNSTKPTEGDEGGFVDLTLLNKVTGNSYVTLLNRETNEYLLIDSRQARINRCRKRVVSWANTLKPFLDKVGCQYKMVMMGLTYRPGVEWRANDIRDFIAKLKREVGLKNIISMARVAELQERGAVHFHIIVIVKQGVRVPFPDKSGLWRHGSSRVEKARSPFYLVSYTKKEYQKSGIYPKGCRMYEVWINPEFVSYVERWYFRLSSLPGWFAEIVRKDIEHEGEKWCRLKGGGWSFADHVYKSKFVFIGIVYT